MKRFLQIVAAFACAAGALALVGCGATSNQTATQPTITAVALTPASIPLAPGGTQALVVTATQSNGASVPVTTGVTFTSANTNVATVSASGVVTAGEVSGTSAITATVSTDLNQTLTTAPSTVTVSVALTAIAVTPATKNLAVGGTQ